MSSTSTVPTSRSTLPAPTGTHPIGRISTECEDRDRVDPYAPDPVTPRDLVLWIWYPADPTSSGAPADFRDVKIGGPAGLINIALPQERPRYIARAAVVPPVAGWPVAAAPAGFCAWRGQHST